MTISRLNERESCAAIGLKRLVPRLATLVMLGIGALFVAVGVSWQLGQPTIANGFAQLEALQDAPPLGVQVIFSQPDLLLAPTIGLLLIVFGVMKLSPTPQPWSRWVVVSIILVLTGRYVLWRSLSSLNLTTPLNGMFSLLLLGFELITIVAGTLQLVLLLRRRDRRREADVYSEAVLSGDFRPSVDVMIPSYDEPAFILRRTIIGCQAMDYPNKTIYLLDDTRRPEIRALAHELGCQYLTRPDNRFAKAGNLNHAITKTSGELITVFDADFVPTTNFLTRTVGFFQQSQIALVQTPQAFYNIDPVTRNLGLEKVTPPEEETFYDHIQPLKDGAGGVVCAGTSFVVRRRSLEEVGGFVTESLSEDYFTAIRISARGHQIVYLSEKLSAGLAAENIAAHAMQRVRWGQGTLQAFFISSNPLTIPGLTLMQRLSHFEGLLNWFGITSRVIFLLMPLAYAFLGVIPVQSKGVELVYFFLPYYVVQLCVFAWLNGRSRSAFLSDVYSVVLCLPLSVVVIRAMLRPFGKGFKVTPKGTASSRFAFNWALAWPLLALFIATAVSIWMIVNDVIDPLGLSGVENTDMPTFGLGWVWSAYNLFILGIALWAMVDAPNPYTSPWFHLQRRVTLQVQRPSATQCNAAQSLIKAGRKLQSAAVLDAIAAPPMTYVTGMSNYTSTDRPYNEVLWGTTTLMSEEGAEIRLSHTLSSVDPDSPIPVTLTLLEDRLTIPGQIMRTRSDKGDTVVRIEFQPLPLAQQRQLIALLYCRPGQWKRLDVPNELRSLFCMVRALLMPRFLFGRSLDISAVQVNQD